jgi:hypothetical protein
MVNSETVRAGARDVRHTMVEPKIDAQYTAAVQERGQYGPCFVGDRKQLARVFTLERDTHGGKPVDGVVDCEGREHVFDDPSITEEIIGRDLMMSDIAAPAAGDENFGADRLRPVQQDDPKGAGEFCSLCRGESGCESRRSSSDNGDIAAVAVIHIRHF